MSSDCTAFILAGGKSTRMGEDKGLLKFGAESLVESSIRMFRELTSDIRIVGDPQRYSRFGVPVIADCVPSCGPLSGIYTGLKNSSRRSNLFLACDMPLMRPELFRLLLSKALGADAVVVRFDDGFIEPLSSVYSISCQPAIEANFAVNRFKISDFFSKVAVSYVGEKELSDNGLSREIFTNVNTPEEFRRIQK